MYTQCPQCMTYFQVTTEHLKIAQGNVRCGHCRNVFSALGNLTEHLPEPTNEESDDFENDDFLTDEELGEFEDFDTNIYDDEDSIFDAFIDEEDNTAVEPAQEQVRPDKAAKPVPATKPTTAAKPSVNRTANAKQAASATDNPPTSSALKKLASLREGQKAYLEKLQQAMRQREQEELKRQTRNVNASKEPVASSAKTRDTAIAKTQTRPVPATPPKTTPSAKPTSSAATTPSAKSKPAAAKPPSPTTANPATRPQQTKAQPAASASVKNTRNAPARKPDIPVQTSGDDVDFDTALQALDELEINDEHADFVASVIKEFEATNIATTQQGASAQPEKTKPPTPATDGIATSRAANKVNAPRPQPVVAHQNISDGPNTQTPLQTPPAPIEEKTGKKKIFGLKKAKPNTKKKSIKKRLKKVAKKPPPQPVIEANIPTLPAILREGYQEEVAQHRLTPAAIAWSIGSMLLMLVFLGQTVYFKHDQLAHISTFRPWIEHFCHRFNCEVSLQYDASELQLLGQDIRSHPKVKNALMVSTTIINKAGYRQAYPGLQLTFTDMNGQKVAMRRFLPEEYLPKGTNIKRGIPPNTPIQVELQLMDPGSNAINFEFEFFKTI